MVVLLVVLVWMVLTGTVGSDGGVDGGCGDSDSAGSIGRSRLCGSGFEVK